MQYNKTDTKKANGTSLQGYVNTTFDKLNEVFGEPLYPNSGDGKVICEWVLEWEDGTISTIYCWKVNQVPMGEYNWHIGGNSQKSVDHVTKKMEYLM